MQCALLGCDRLLVTAVLSAVILAVIAHYDGTQLLLVAKPDSFCSAGTGYAVLHRHILPHEDEGCMLKTQILSKVYQPESLPGGASSQGGKAGITLAALAVFVCLIVVPVVMYKRKKKARQAEQEALVSNEVAQSGV